ncbi:hypothetical protein ACSTQ1_006499 [Pseudomonas aeruginosa]|uniref:hypothetical protein n=1 Tax=Pseudomonas aeruginosa TaxID=287 RepID=UPI00053D6182|nr:hypothetical protein [Pseudomonas aeruginosa]MBN0831987.1 hypothetical protein [Pseudomonas aeruginosa]MDO1591778.1 hypothetical protein [Pseudomonas aeruginosa]MDO1598298.1 hypothetical protein [Pseudomonas aeruginosa]HCF0869982.1 hypothetical protein [Pseudomonas aeruginosa]HEH9462588.1 hypothetical protein [Pseudomonas aeruginosa]
MARKASTPRIDHMPEINQEAFQEDVNAVGVLGAIAQGMHEERDLVNQILGQVQMARSIARFADVVSLSKLAHIKETKLYRALQGKKGFDPDGNEIADVGTWDGFCQALGLSRSKVDEDLTNLNAFGEEALNQLSAIGAGYRELRQWRKLPDDARSALIEAAKQGNKDAVEYLAEELIATHTKEKAALEKQVEDLRADNEALGERMARKSRELDETVHELEKTKRRIQTMKADEAEKELRQEATAIAFEAEADISGKLREAFSVMLDHAEKTGTDPRTFQAGLVRHLEKLLLQIREEFQLPDGEAPDDISEFGWIEQMGKSQPAGVAED